MVVVTMWKTASLIPWKAWLLSQENRLTLLMGKTEGAQQHPVTPGRSGRDDITMGRMERFSGGPFRPRGASTIRLKLRSAVAVYAARTVEAEMEMAGGAVFRLGEGTSFGIQR